MPNYNFKEDFPVALETEKEVANILEKLYNVEIIRFENTIKYDILARSKGKDFKFEVKEDFMTWKTGNVALEFECRGKPSGIQISEADYYIYKIHANEGINFLLCKTSTLKKLVEEQKYFRVVDGGDKGSHSMNYLFRYNVFAENSRLIASIP